MRDPLSHIWRFFEQVVFTFNFDPVDEFSLFNPYNQEISSIDRPGAAGIRQQNLKNYLDSFPKAPEYLLLGEAPGWRGCRFSGVPFTSEAQFGQSNVPFQGEPTSISGTYREASATIFWNTLRVHHPRAFAWNIMPFHPHHIDVPLSNRRPSRSEIDWALPVLIRLINLLAPIRIIAVGKVASSTLAKINIPALTIRHPSHGGAQIFRSEILSYL